jgi:ribosome-associated protein
VTREVEIRGEVIRLGQLLKLVGAVDAGGDAKALLAEGGGTVNGEPEARRGRQLRAGDEVRIGEAGPLFVVCGPRRGSPKTP